MNSKVLKSLIWVFLVVSFEPLFAKPKKNNNDFVVKQNKEVFFDGENELPNGVSSNTINLGKPDEYLKYVSSVNIKVSGKLVVYGDLELTGQKKLKIEKGGIVIVTGKLIMTKHSVIDVKGFLIANEVQANWNGNGNASFSGGAKNVYINSVTPGSRNKMKLNVLHNKKDKKIIELKNDNEPVWQYYKEVTEMNGGEIKVDGDSEVCFNNVLPSLVNVAIAHPNSYKVYVWYHSPDQNSWKKMDGGDQDEYSFGETTFTVGKHYFLRRASKRNHPNDYTDSNVISITILSLPSPDGIYHD